MPSQQYLPSRKESDVAELLSLHFSTSQVKPRSSKNVGPSMYDFFHATDIKIAPKRNLRGNIIHAKMAKLEVSFL
ncbi:hypothetical protein J2736_003556 [Paenibacillus qinlingensis]|uniref:Uncharacterized protein n=1 Tax=Paenibacillus qinlingensis TaxID=1837343 RepID=A0ABU1NXZ4_9BACL|nr:hypothetical protein [Paenibacillus qinlingensis]